MVVYPYPAVLQATIMPPTAKLLLHDPQDRLYIIPLSWLARDGAMISSPPIRWIDPW
jgi:hypothetical protein